jgi:hypothetical protein
MRYRDLINEEEVIRGWAVILALPEPAKSNAIKAFDGLAKGQLGKPENMGGACNGNPNIHHGAGLYAWDTEHIGDLTHRMADGEHVVHGNCGYGTVAPKVRKALRYLRNEYGHEREIMDNIRNNFEYRKEDGRYHGTYEQFFEELKQAGRVYANAHAALTVYNEAQWNARQAAVEVGLMNFPQVEIHLAALEKNLGDPKTWAAYAGLVMIDPAEQPIQFKK